MDRLLAEERILFGDDESKIIELKVYAAEFEDKLSSVFELYQPSLTQTHEGDSRIG